MSRGKLWGVALWHGLYAVRSLGAFTIALFATACLVVPSASASVPSTAIRYFYTPNNRLSAVIKPEAEYALYTWDAAGNLSSIARKSSTKLSIIQLEPAKGAVGETVDIWGTGFSTTPANDTVKFNGTAATVSAATADTLAVKVPSGATTGTVTVQTMTEGPVTSSQSFTVSSSAVPGAPTITSLSASVAAAGSVVTITGTGFETNAEYDYVTVNRTTVEVTSATSTSLKFVVPEATSSGTVSVSTRQGSVVGSYLYIPPPGYTTTQIGPTATLALKSASALTVASAKTVGLATIEVTGGEMMSVVLKSVTLGAGTTYIYGPHDEKLSEKAFASGEEQLIEPVPLAMSGTYTVLIVPSGENTGKVEVTPYYADTVTGTLTPTAEGSSKSVSLATPGQKAELTISGTAGEEVSVKVSEFSSFGKPVWLEWFNTNDEDFKEARFTSIGFVPAVKLSVTGTYELVVNPNGINTGSLKVTAYNATAVTGSITPTGSGESKVVTTSVPGQSANITFSGTAGEEVSLVLSESTFKYGNISLLTPEGSSLSGASIGFGTSTVMDGPSSALVLPTTGTYTIHIDGSEEETGSVKLTAYKANQVTGSLMPSSSGASENVSLPTPDQKAWYTVSGTAGEEVSLKVSEFSFSKAAWLEWFNPKGEDFKEKSFTGNGFMQAVTLSTTGTYHLAVNPNGLNTGSLKLTAYSPITGSITPSSGGESKVVTTNAPGQNARITFSVKSSEEVSLVLSESTFKSGTVLIDNPEGSRVGEEKTFGSSGETTLGPVSLSTTGTYTILIKSEGESSGSVKLTAYIGSPPHGLIIRRSLSDTSSLATPNAPNSITPATAVNAATPATSPAAKHNGAVSARKSTPRERARMVASGAASVVALPAAVRSFRPEGSGEWSPRSASGYMVWSTGQPASPWAKLAPPAPTDGAGTALAGQALKLNGLPLAGVHLAVQDTGARAVTDTRGQFLLTGMPAGHQVLVVEGGTVGGKRYGTYLLSGVMGSGERFLFWVLGFGVGCF